MPFISVDAGRLYYERVGTGQPVLLVTGLVGYASYWQPQIAVLAESFTVVTYDHIGIGRSDRPVVGYSVEGMACEALALADALGFERFHVVGHSTGGCIAQILASDHPERIASAVVASSWTKSDLRFRRLFDARKELLLKCGPAAYVGVGAVMNYPASWVRENATLLEGMEAGALADFPPVEVASARIDAIVEFDCGDRLDRIAVPCLITAARDDQVTPAYYSEELAERIPGAALRFADFGGHCFNLIVPEEFNRIVRGFLDESARNGERPDA